MIETTPKNLKITLLIMKQTLFYPGMRKLFAPLKITKVVFTSWPLLIVNPHLS